MAQLLYSAKDGQGKAVQGFVDAGSVLEARQQLIAQGLTEVVMHQDTTVPTDPRSLAGLGPEQQRELARLSIATMRQPGLAPLLRHVAETNRWWLAVDLGLVAWGVARSNPWLMASGAALALFPFAMTAWQYRHGDRYNALLKAFATGDWKQVRALAQKLREVSRGVQNMEFDLDLRLAAIRARAGQLREALADVEPWRARVATPGTFENRVAAVYAAAGDRAGFVRLMAESHDKAPQEPARVLDHALAQARFGDVELAARLLRELDPALLPPHAQAFVAWTSGMVQLRQQQPGALDQLGQAVAEFLKLAAQPAAWPALAFCTCDHAIALAMAGRKDEACQQVAQVWPIVRAHADAPLLRLLQTEGLEPH
jgi:hypothetical protein